MGRNKKGVKGGLGLERFKERGSEGGYRDKVVKQMEIRVEEAQSAE